MQKWKPERNYEKVGAVDEESPDAFRQTDMERRISRRNRTRSLISSIVVTGLMVVCIAGIVWWPAQIQNQAMQLTGNDHSHDTHPAHPAHPAHGGSEPHNFEHLGPSSSCENAQPKNKSPVATCGKTWQEAMALNCTWDLLAAGWVPPECLDTELTEDFRAQGPWKFYADKDGKQELTEEDLHHRVGEGNEFYTTLKYHKVHCSYQWRKMHRAMERGGKIENKLANYHHTMHCGYVQMQQGDLEDLMTKITGELMTC